MTDPSKRPGPFAQDLSRTPPTKEQREKDYLPEKKEIGESFKPKKSDTAEDFRPKSQRGERKTEDQIAQERLGGVKGSPELSPAPLTRQEAEQISSNIDPGHVA